MAVLCPKPCGRLATAAVFIAIGVVQLLVGIILLRSKFADLLSGADFLSSATNIFVGCLYGIASSVWQNNAKNITTKRTARKNALAALLVTVIAVNTTAVIILIMSEGNELLSLPYFNDHSGHSSVTFAKEVFACAYIASVCSPIVCLVVALVALSGNCFKIYSTQNTNQNDSDKIRNPFGWVYDEKCGQKSCSDATEASSKTSSSENSVSSASSDFSSLKRKSILHPKSVDSPMHEWQQKRARILENSELSRKCSPSDVHFKNENVVNVHPERLIQRPNESLNKYLTKNGINREKDSKFDRTSSSSKENVMPNPGLYHSSDGTDYKKVRSDSYSKAILEENGIISETKFQRKCASMVNKAFNTEEVNMENKYCGRRISPKRIVQYSLDDTLPKTSYGSSHKSPEEVSEVNSENKYCGRRKSPKRIGSVQYSLDETIPKTSYVSTHKSPVEVPDSHTKEIEDPEITRLKLQTLQELKRRVSKAPPASNARSYSCKERNFTNHITKEKLDCKHSMQELSPRKITVENAQSEDSEETSSPGEVFEPRKDSVAAIKYFPNPKNTSPTSISRNYSASYPKPLDLRIAQKVGVEINENRRHSRPKTNSSEITPNNQFKTPGDKETEKYFTEVPCAKLMKQDTPRRVASLASIAEVPSEEFNGSPLDRDSPVHVRTASLDESSMNVDENSNVTVHSSPPRRFSESPALIKSRSFSPKSILKKMWSLGPEVRLSMADMIVDEDSLIGLSDEELLARTYRIRSLRKNVEERLKRENKMKTEETQAENLEKL